MEKMNITTNEQFTREPGLCMSQITIDTKVIKNYETKKEEAKDKFLVLSSMYSNGEIDFDEMAEKSLKAFGGLYWLEKHAHKMYSKLEAIDTMKRAIVNSTKSGDIMTYDSLKHLGRKLGLIKKNGRYGAEYYGFNYVREALRELIDIGYIEVVIGNVEGIDSRYYKKFYIVK